jgi:hypothetical protein
MPRTDQAFAIELAVSEGPSIVRAHVFDAVDLAVDLD